MLLANCSANTEVGQDKCSEENADWSSVVLGCCMAWGSNVVTAIRALGYVTSASLEYKVDFSSCRSSLEAHCKSIWGGAWDKTVWKSIGWQERFVFFLRTNGKTEPICQELLTQLLIWLWYEGASISSSMYCLLHGTVMISGSCPQNTFSYEFDFSLSRTCWAQGRL